MLLNYPNISIFKKIGRDYAIWVIKPTKLEKPSIISYSIDKFIVVFSYEFKCICNFFWCNEIKHKCIKGILVLLTLNIIAIPMCNGLDVYWNIVCLNYSEIYIVLFIGNIIKKLTALYETMYQQHLNTSFCTLFCYELCTFTNKHKSRLKYIQKTC